MTTSVTLGPTTVAPGNSAAVPVNLSGFTASDQLQFSLSCPPGLSVPWSAGQVGGILGITLSASPSMAPGTYSVPYTVTDVTADLTFTGTFSVTVTAQQYAYALAGPNQVTRALSRLTSAFKNQPNNQAILKSLLVGFPEIENVFWQIINGRLLNYLVPAVAAGENTGTQIDILGGLVGELRQGRVDASYLPAVIVRIRVNRSKGRAEDVIQVANMLYPGAIYSESPGDSWNVKMLGVVSVSVPTIANLLGKTKAIGTSGSLEYSSWPANENLLLDYTVAQPTGGLVLDYTAAQPVSGAGVLTGLVTCSPS